MTQNTEDTPGKQVKTFVYVGVERSVTNKKLAQFVDVTNKNMGVGINPSLHGEETHLYDWKKCRKAVMLTVGNEYTVEGVPDGSSIYISTMKYAGSWPERDVVLELTAKDRANSRAMDAEDMAKKNARIDPLKDALRPVRWAYKDSTHAARVQLLAWAVAFITGAVSD